MDISFGIPETATLRQKIGDSVKIGDALYTFATSEDVTVSVTQELGVQPQEIFQYIDLTVGQPVKTGSLIASKKGMIGKKQVVSPHNGTIKQIDYVNGGLVIAVTSEEHTGDVASFFNGIIKAFDAEKHVLTITIPKAIEIKLKEVSDNGGGEYFYFKDESAYFNISEDEVKNKIIIIDELAPHIETKLEALSCIGFFILKGTPSTGPETPWAKPENEADFKALIESKNTHIVFSKKEKKALAYTI